MTYFTSSWTGVTHHKKFKDRICILLFQKRGPLLTVYMLVNYYCGQICGTGLFYSNEMDALFARFSLVCECVVFFGIL
jgi:hypothetical protein